MAAMTGVAIGPVPSGMNLGGFGNARGAGNNVLIVPFTAIMSTSYSTGGDTIAMPATEITGHELVCLVLATTKVGARRYNWNGSASAPKIMAYSAFDTEVTAATDLSAVTMIGLMYFAG